MTVLEADNSEITSAYDVEFTETTCTASNGATVHAFKGTGFGDADPVTGAPRDGIITDWSVDILGAEIFDITKMSLSWADYHAYTEANNTTALMGALFHGKDVIVGSKGNDVLFALDLRVHGLCKFGGDRDRKGHDTVGVLGTDHQTAGDEQLEVRRSAAWGRVRV